MCQNSHIIIRVFAHLPYFFGTLIFGKNAEISGVISIFFTFSTLRTVIVPELSGAKNSGEQ